MFQFLIRWILPQDPLLVAIDKRDSRLIAYILRNRKFSILGYPQSDGLDPDTFTQQELLSQIQQDANAVSGDHPIQPMTVEHNGRAAVLAFTKPRFLSAYVQQLVMKLDRVVGIPTYEISGVTLMRTLTDECDVLLNAGSRDERILDLKVIAQ